MEMLSQCGPIISDAYDRVQRYGKYMTKTPARYDVEITHGYGDLLRVPVLRVTVPTEEVRQSQWTERDSENGTFREYKVNMGFPLGIDGNGLSVAKWRSFVESLPGDSIKTLIHDDLGHQGWIHDIFQTVFAYVTKSEDIIVKKALDCWLAYRLATCQRFLHNSNGIIESGQVEAQTSKFHGQVALFEFANTEIRHLALLAWGQLRGELEQHFLTLKEDQACRLWLSWLVLLSNDEDVMFDQMFRDLGPVEEMKERPLVNSGGPPDSSDMAQRAVFKILDKSKIHRQTIARFSKEDPNSAFDRNNVDSLTGLLMSKFLDKYMPVKARL
ncbi:hypothetical protein BKA56DRAFT_600991 [Ilyonectria sp. MPI-CAGE-AT-0026]|nr:hypothetical protein BKA56DRAFT_600991 [Ilyonectria sp. MPI-CAGE-AT-0026]